MQFFTFSIVWSGFFRNGIVFLCGIHLRMFELYSPTRDECLRHFLGFIHSKTKINIPQHMVFHIFYVSCDDKNKKYSFLSYFFIFCIPGCCHRIQGIIHNFPCKLRIDDRSMVAGTAVRRPPHPHPPPRHLPLLFLVAFGPGIFTMLCQPAAFDQQ